MKRVCLAVLLALSACARPPDLRDEAPASPPPSAAAQSIDWSQAETVTVTMVDYAFQPNFLIFKQGRPTRLVIENISANGHNFISPRFFHTIAVRRIITSRADYENQWVARLPVELGETVEMWFVPRKAGRFPLECTVTGHDYHGMRGEILVEED